MQVVIAATGNSVKSCLSAARAVLGVKFKDARETLRSGGEDGLYRVHLANGVVVECSLVQHACAEAWSTNLEEVL